MPIPWTVIAIAVVMNCVWGGNPVAVKLSLEAFPPFWTAFLRFCLGIACVGVWARLAGIRLFPSAEEWKPFLGLSLLFGVQIWVMNVGFGLTTGVMGSVLNSVYPLVAALLGPLAVAGDRLDAIRGLGLVAAFIGTATVLLGETATGELELLSTGNWLVLLSGTLLGIRLVVSTRVIRRHRSGARHVLADDAGAALVSRPVRSQPRPSRGMRSDGGPSPESRSRG